uniref:Uncharacterized protein n=1 Tax=Solanum tuberosum TaxID=4113 RepID=M1C6X7_SOLTU
MRSKPTTVFMAFGIKGLFFFFFFYVLSVVDIHRYKELFENIVVGWRPRAINVSSN